MFSTLKNIFRKHNVVKQIRYKGAKLDEQDLWYTHSKLVNQLISTASPRLRSRVRDLVRNYPVFTRAVSAYAAFNIGQGPSFKSKALNPDGTPNTALSNKLDINFKKWMERGADASGKMHFYELMLLMCRQLIESGEAFIQLNLDKTRIQKGENPLSLMPVESDRIYSTNYSPALSYDDIITSYGLEYDKNTGKVVAYYVQEEENSFNTMRVPADNMLHIYETLRPGQLRGVTPLAPAIIFARAMSQYAGSELDTQKIASRYLAMITTPDPSTFQKVRGKSGSDDDKREDIDDIENALIEYLRPGEKIEFADLPNRPGTGFSQFEFYTTRMVGLCVNLSYEVLSGDYQKLSYSTSKAVRGDNAFFLAPDRLRIEQTLRRIYYEWLKNEALVKDYVPSYYFTSPELIENHTWTFKERGSVDPLRDASADVKYLQAGLKSQQEIIIARGGDPDAVLNDIAEFNQKLEEKGLSLATPIVSTAIANNPAAIGGSEE